MNLLIESSKFAFLLTSRRAVALILITCAILIPFYQAMRFNVGIDLSFLLKTSGSLFVASVFYLFAFGFGKFTSIIADSMFKKSAVEFLFAPLLLLFALNFLLYWNVFSAENWVAFSNVFNPNLVLIAAFWGLGSFCFSNSLFPSNEYLSNSYREFLTKHNPWKMIAILIVTTFLILALNFTQFQG